jgi:hypothetical protein
LSVLEWGNAAKSAPEAQAEAALGYRPDPRSVLPLEQLTGGTVGLYGEDELDRAEGAARGWLGEGPTRKVGRPARLELAPYAALAALLPVAFLIWRRNP